MTEHDELNQYEDTVETVRPETEFAPVDIPPAPAWEQSPECPELPPLSEEPQAPSEAPEQPAPSDEPAPPEPPAPSDTADRSAVRGEADGAGVDAAGRRPRLPYHQRAYLLYGGEPEAKDLDLDATLGFLRELGFDGGELRQARQGQDYSGAMQPPDPSGKKMTCSYCGADISGVDFHRMPDGRLRCNTCSRTLVTTKEDLSRIYRRILDNMDAFFGATITVPVDIEMLDERALKKKLKRPLSEVDDKSILILGVAVNQRKKYSIYLENGAPRISLIATFAHELTHIWQYTHWNESGAFPKLPAKKRLLMYEGMAKWAEIQYLYLVGETAVAKREEAYTRSRNDEYGIGFCLYADRYPLSNDAMVCGETPFRTDGYPID